ncbi:MAG: hypothetical protein O3A58_04270 [Proteobacteria bacterium]|nr:hypothetical protein [Pseudomonadota bacterium]
MTTNFTGVEITSSSTTGTQNKTACLIAPNVTESQRNMLQNKKNGSMIYNITAQKFQILANQKWISVSEINPPAEPDPGLNTVAFVLPFGAQKEVENIPRANGFMYLDTTNNQVRGYINSKWLTFYATQCEVPGLGITNGSPMIFPSGAQKDVEVIKNEIDGFIYYDTTNNQLRIFEGEQGKIGNGIWRSIKWNE